VQQLEAAFPFPRFQQLEAVSDHHFSFLSKKRKLSVFVAESLRRGYQQSWNVCLCRVPVFHSQEGIARRDGENRNLYFSFFCKFATMIRGWSWMQPRRQRDYNQQMQSNILKTPPETVQVANTTRGASKLSTTASPQNHGSPLSAKATRPLLDHWS
jgi:hypothetical protein